MTRRKHFKAGAVPWRLMPARRVPWDSRADLALSGYVDRHSNDVLVELKALGDDDAEHCTADAWRFEDFTPCEPAWLETGQAEPVEWCDDALHRKPRVRTHPGPCRPMRAEPAP